MIEYIKEIVCKEYDKDALTYLKYIVTINYAKGSNEEKDKLIKVTKECLQEESVMSIYYRIYLSHECFSYIGKQS